MSEVIKNKAYTDWLKQLKDKVRTAQIKAAVKVNEELLRLYWFFGSQIVEKQKKANWGEGFLKQLSNDLQSEFPEMKGFSATNLKYMRNGYLFFRDAIRPQPADVSKNRPQLVDELDNQPFFRIPWGHNREIISKCKDIEEALFYVQKTIENGWSRNVLVHQIESDLFRRSSKAISNFWQTLPAPHSDLALQTLKDPYHFDFLTMREKYDERELGNALRDISKPIGVSEYKLMKRLPEEYQSSLPTIEEIEQELMKNKEDYE
ncbi:DUF1016 N-terminal domain-containing protein [Candidatus Sulfidibacterium hydrothermale]|uniref:DUF1016 N-terminal domain-containing protein n=1 Tax=Candidatus Sulfidibacterium hydrothermale TaxID=2875962 RepID=UPI001F0B466C|nr:DUF1016 N-terminal domain-containing protein [Candidatus Sulfidibacterium hydrothermale]UBM62788.1 DUF1016 N-terminal domain-containing protein [Candidatus Sulfidibacterium hydrothermale]